MLVIVDGMRLNAGTSGMTFSYSAINAGAGFTWAVNDTLTFDAPLTYNYSGSKSYMPAGGTVYLYKPHTLGIRPKLTAELKPAGMGLRFTGGIDTFFAFAEVDTSGDPVKESPPA